jgi:hypothetical protein
MSVTCNVNSFTGQVGITLTIDWCEPKENTSEHEAACERFQQFQVSVHTGAESTGDVTVSTLKHWIWFTYL